MGQLPVELYDPISDFVQTELNKRCANSPISFLTGPNGTKGLPIFRLQR
jgi:hypothetical protein